MLKLIIVVVGGSKGNVQKRMNVYFYLCVRSEFSRCIVSTIRRRRRRRGERKEKNRQMIISTLSSKA